MKRQAGAIIGGVGLIVAGGWIVAIQLGIRLAGLRYIWPALVALLGLMLLVQVVFQKRKQGGLVFLGVTCLLIGGFLSLFSLRVGGLSWADLARYWPVIPLSLACALMMLYLAEGMRQQALLVPTYIIGGIGLVALPFTLGVLQGTVMDQVVQLWPLLVILIILALFVRPRPPHKTGGSGTE